MLFFTFAILRCSRDIVIRDVLSQEGAFGVIFIGVTVIMRDLSISGYQRRSSLANKILCNNGVMGQQLD